MIETNIELEIQRIADKFTEERKLNKILIFFQHPKESTKKERKKCRGYYDRKENKIYISLERAANSLIFRTLAHELTHVLSPIDINHKALFWQLMNEQTLPFVKKNLQSEEEKINLERLVNPSTNEAEE